MTPNPPHLLTKPDEIKAMAAELATQDAIGVDTEFIRETSFFPKIALIQVATGDKAWLVDPTVLSKEDLAPFLQILQDPKILKIMHAAVADQECFYWSYGFLATPVFDTAVGAALCGMGDSIGLQKLLKEILSVHLPKGRARAKWLARPLSRELLDYAEKDVVHLVELKQELKARLDKYDRFDWAVEESEVSEKVFDVSAEDLGEKIARGANLEKEQPILVELLRWREGRARDANLPRMWIADNETLISLARVQPKSIEEMKTFRGLHIKEVERSGRRILEAIEKGKELMIGRTVEPRREMPRIDSHAADFVQTYIAYLADKLEIMPRFLVSSQQAVRILYHVDKSIDEWVSEEILSARAAALVGNELKAIFSGQKALVLKNKRLGVIDV